MAINLHTKYDKNIAEAFAKESLLSGKLKADYSFVGARTVAVSTLQTVAMSSYDRTATSNRYGTPVEVQDTVQEMTMSQDRGFALTIDKGNNADQNGIKMAGQMLRLQIRERMVPESDKYALERLCQLAGKVNSNGTALSSSTVCGAIDDGIAHLDDKEVPEDGRHLFVSATTYKLLKQSGADLAVDGLARDAWAKGQVAMYGNMPVIKVPSGRWPTHAEFIIVYEKSAVYPQKLNETKLHQDPPGISGNLLEGRHYYDLFVLGTKCDGVYVSVFTGNGGGTVCAAPTYASATAALSSTTTGASIKFTTDGSDPRYSRTAKTGTTVDVTTAGTVVKAYTFKAGAYPSGLTVTTLS